LTKWSIALTVLATNLARRGVKQEFDEFPTDQIGERLEDVILLVFHGIGQLKLATFFAPKSRRRDHGARSPAPSQATDPVSHGRSAIGNGSSLRIPFRPRLNDSKLRQIRTILGSPPGVSTDRIRGSGNALFYWVFRISSKRSGEGDRHTD
jgi:hypothetical protein